MSAGYELTVYLICSMVAAVVAAVVARMKRRNAGFWTVASFIFPPLLLILIFLPKRAVAPRPASSRRDPDSLDEDDNLDNRSLND